MSAPRAAVRADPARAGGTAGVTAFSTVLILSPLIQWLYLTAYFHFAPLEIRLASPGGLPLAMQAFFAPGNVLAVVLGVGLLRRSEWTRRVARFVFLLAIGITAVHLGRQAIDRVFDSTSAQAAISLAFAAVYFWYFGRPGVRAQFAARVGTAGPPEGTAAAVAPPGQAAHPRALLACAGIEIVLGLVAGALTARLWANYQSRVALERATEFAMSAEEALFNLFIFVAFAALLSPLLLTAIAGAGILLRRATAATARRYSTVACWTAIGCVLLAAWLISRPELGFDAHDAALLVGFGGFSLAWHLWFLRVLARSRPPADANPGAGAATR